VKNCAATMPDRAALKAVALRLHHTKKNREILRLHSGANLLAAKAPLSGDFRSKEGTKREDKTWPLFRSE
jgi:hypothetical protein